MIHKALHRQLVIDPDVKHWREHDTWLEIINLVVAGMVKQAEIVSQEWPNRGIRVDNCILQLVASNHYEQDTDVVWAAANLFKHADSVAFIIHAWETTWRLVLKGSCLYDSLTQLFDIRKEMFLLEFPSRTISYIIY